MILVRVKNDADEIAEVEIYRTESNPGGIHLYRFYATVGEEGLNGYVNHAEKDGVLVLIRRVLDRIPENPAFEEIHDYYWSEGGP